MFDRFRKEKVVKEDGPYYLSPTSRHGSTIYKWYVIHPGLRADEGYDSKKLAERRIRALNKHHRENQ